MINMQSKEHKEFSKTLAKILDVADMCNTPEKLKNYIKTEVWELFHKLGYVEECGDIYENKREQVFNK